MYLAGGGGCDATQVCLLKIALKSNKLSGYCIYATVRQLKKILP